MPCCFSVFISLIEVAISKQEQLGLWNCYLLFNNDVLNDLLVHVMNILNHALQKYGKIRQYDLKYLKLLPGLTNNGVF